MIPFLIGKEVPPLLPSLGSVWVRKGRVWLGGVGSLLLVPPPSVWAFRSAPLLGLSLGLEFVMVASSVVSPAPAVRKFANVFLVQRASEGFSRGDCMLVTSDVVADPARLGRLAAWFSFDDPMCILSTIRVRVRDEQTLKASTALHTVLMIQEYDDTSETEYYANLADALERASYLMGLGYEVEMGTERLYA